ncbi:uncharacterized protein ACOB8E_009882 [Sarcophilus harrisii]
MNAEGRAPLSRAHACTIIGSPSLRSCQSRSGACHSQPLQPPALHPRPSVRSPFSSPQEWGSRCSGSRAQWLARAVSVRPARAASRSPSVSGAEGSVKRRQRRFLFPFLPLLPKSGVASSSTPPSLLLLLPLPGAATAGGGCVWRRAAGVLLPPSTEHGQIWNENSRRILRLHHVLACRLSSLPKNQKVSSLSFWIFTFSFLHTAKSLLWSNLKKAHMILIVSVSEKNNQIFQHPETNPVDNFSDSERPSENILWW